MAYCDICQNTGEVDCYCGGDLCICGQETIECPKCGGGRDREEDPDDGFGDVSKPPLVLAADWPESMLKTLSEEERAAWWAQMQAVF